MAENTVRYALLASFRDVWVTGRLDYQRAADALEAAIRSVEAMRREAGARIDEQLQLAEQGVEDARRRLSEIEGVLERQFNSFCGVDPWTNRL
jgi:hypothetical protein